MIYKMIYKSKNWKTYLFNLLKNWHKLTFKNNSRAHSNVKQ